ncbi:hypothetical protein H1P_6960001 [Hyella patelloides LEGE 07179]|uniref:Uncharacterized protein n=1 Tax=Hyella patelloides LEGE 07179 TaxID=945734 RepID=A0A563W387_9CYAN|nr:hypothetical protein H1P_6960001 [Hyella patelloides LEGE 07179]
MENQVSVNITLTMTAKRKILINGTAKFVKSYKLLDMAIINQRKWYKKLQR